MKKLTIIATVATGLALSAAVSQAQVILDTGIPYAISATTPGPSSGPVASLAAPFSTSTQVGTLYSSVYVPDPSWEPVAAIAGGYVGYAFQYSATETGGTSIQTIALDGYANLASVYVAYQPATGVGIPIGATLTGGVLTLFLNPATYAPNSTVTFDVFTTATTYAPNGAGVADGVTANTTDLAPVPEASTVMAGALMLLPLGIGAIRAVRKDRTA